MSSKRWKKLRLTILDRDGRVCYACNGEATEVDHIWPRSKGGDPFDPLNCAAICRKCNLAKSDRFFMPLATPPVFQGTSLPDTVQIVPQSPFNRPDTLNFNAK